MKHRSLLHCKKLIGRNQLFTRVSSACPAAPRSGRASGVAGQELRFFFCTVLATFNRELAPPLWGVNGPVPAYSTQAPERRRCAFLSARLHDESE